MKKILPPQALAILAIFAGTNPGFAMENTVEQEKHFQTAMQKLEAFEKSQKDEDEKIAKIQRKKTKLETLEVNRLEKFFAVLELSSDTAKDQAYKLAGKMDKKNEERDKNSLKIQESIDRSRTEEEIKNQKKYIENLKSFMISEKNRVTERLQDLEKKLQTQPSGTLTFLNMPVMEIGHLLLCEVMNIKFEHTKNSIPYVIQALESIGKSDSKWIQNSKNDFIQSYTVLNNENAARIEKIAKMRDSKAVLKLIEAAK